MIKEQCFTKEWLESFKKQKEHRSIQIGILEMLNSLKMPFDKEYALANKLNRNELDG